MRISSLIFLVFQFDFLHSISNSFNRFEGISHPGQTGEFICDEQTSSCGSSTDQTTCCFTLPQIPNGFASLSSVVSPNNLKNFQLNFPDGSTFDSGDDSSVFLQSIQPTDQCSITTPKTTSKLRFRLTWTFHSNDDNGQIVVPNSTNGSAPVDVLHLNEASAVRQTTDQYNEWFVCPTEQSNQISRLQSISLINGQKNIDNFRCIFVNQQGIPLKDPQTGQVLAFSSTNSDDSPSINSFPNLHVDCLSIQIFPNENMPIDPSTLVFALTIVYQPMSNDDRSDLVPQLSDLQGTADLPINVTIDVSFLDNDDCKTSSIVVPMSFDSSLQKYIGVFDVSSTSSDGNSLSSVTITGSSSIENPIILSLIDQRENVSPSNFNLNNGNPFENLPKTSISKMKIQATAAADAPMDSTLNVQLVSCPTDNFNSSPLPSSSSSSSPPMICQGKLNPIYATYPSDLSPISSTTTNKKPPKNTMKLTSSDPMADAKVYADRSCFDRFSPTTNPFVSDIIISPNSYRNSVDCLSPGTRCSMDFSTLGSATITFLFNTPSCFTSIRIPSPSNVEQFSFSIYDENGTQLSSSSTLRSNIGENPTIQSDPNLCGYAVVIQILNTKNNDRASQVTIEMAACFLNLSATTPSPMMPMANAPPPPAQSNFVPSFQQQPLQMTFASPIVSPGFSTFYQGALSLSAASMTCPANASPLQLQFGYPCVLEMTTSDPNVVLDNRINLGGTGINFQSALPITITVQFNCDVQLIYICPADWKTNIDLFSYKIQSLDNSTSESNFISINEQNQCEPNRLQTNISTRKLIIEIVRTKDQQTPRQVVLDILGCYVSPSDRSNVSFSCSRVSILTHSAIELILVDDGTNVTKDLDFDGRGCSFRSLKPMITILFRSNFSTKFSSIGVFSSNVDQIEIDFFNDDENESKSTKIQSSIQRNPLVSNLSSNFDTTTTLSIILLRTDDRLAPRDVRLSIDVCFREFSTPKNICVEPSRSNQVTSVGNTILPSNYYSSDRCVCVCQNGFVLPSSIGLIQYDRSNSTSK